MHDLTCHGKLVKLETNFSLTQQRIWFLNQYANSSHNILNVMQLNGDLNIDFLSQAITAVFKRHDILRTVFYSRHGQLTAEIRPYSSIYITVNFVTKTDLEKIYTECLKHNFILHQGPLLNIQLLKLNDTTHVLVAVAHHIILDANAFKNFFHEVLMCYQSYLREKAPFPPVLTRQYADFVYWQKKTAAGDGFKKHLDFWHEKLADYPTLNLPTDFQRKALPQVSRNAHCSFHIEKNSLEKLNQLASRNKTTLLAVLITATNIFLSRYTAQNDIIIGTKVTQSEFDQIIGPLENIVLFRNQLSHNTIVSDFLSQVAQSINHAYDHQIVPFELLVEQLCHNRVTGFSPLFQVLLVLSFARQENNLDFLYIKAEKICTRQNLMGMDLAFFIEENAQGLDGYLSYNDSLFATSSILRMVENFKTLLDGIAGYADKKIGELPIINSKEYHYLLYALNDTQKNYPDHICVHQIFEKQVAKTPERVAIVFEKQQLTYRELNAKANQLAHFLRNSDIRPNCLVAISIKRSVELLVGLLGILKSGAGYVALEPDYPEERLQFMLSDSNAKILLTHSTVESKFISYTGKKLLIDKDWEAIAIQSSENPENLSNSQDLAFLLYTSGSTGKPKGVLGHHLSILNRIRWMWEQFPYHENEICCLKTALSSAPSIWDIFQPLLCGIKLVIAPNDILKNPRAMIKLLADYSVTRLGVVPSLLRILLECHPNLSDQLPKLKFWEVGGEALSPDLARLFLKTFPAAKIINRYGATEAISVLHYDISDDWDRELAAIPLGKPIANTKAYVLDKELKLLPYGSIGELYISSAGLAKGYNRDDLTAKSFIPSPYAIDECLYKTGDWVRWLSNGNLALLGRQDDQINIRGFRVELNEVQAVLSANPEIAESLILSKGNYEDKYLVAYYVPTSTNAVISPEKIRIYLSHILADYMIPSFFVCLDQFPCLPNGKINRQLLPEPDNSFFVNKYIPPRDKVEREMAMLWQQLFSKQDIGVLDDFFLLGGNSLLAIKLLYKIHDQFNIDLPVSALFIYKTIEEMAVLIKKHDPNLSYYQPLIKINHSESGKKFFLAPPAGGSPFRYHKLQKYLNGGFSLFVLESPNLYPTHNKLLTIEDMASFYLAEIRKLQPQGPYYLGGWSHGGLVAFEMAQQLKKINEEVKLLFMIDTYAAKGKIKNIADMVDTDNLGKILIKSHVFPIDCDPDRIELMVQNFKISAHSSKLYQPKSYNGNLVLLKASDPTDEDAPNELVSTEIVPYNGWGEFVLGHIEEHIIPGTHNNLMLEGAQLIADILMKL